MFKAIKDAINGLFSDGEDELIRPDAMYVQDESSIREGHAIIDAFTAPDQLPFPVALELIDTVVANRPDAEQLREALAVRLIKSRGIDMYGAEIHDYSSMEPNDPDLNPNHLYVSPYARPTAGSTVMVSYQDDKGERYVALVRNWKDPRDHSKGVKDCWQFPGGYMDVWPGKAADQNLDATAVREVREEIKLKLSAPEQLFVRSDIVEGHKTHAIDAFYLADIGQHHEAPPVLAGDDVAHVEWVNIRDVQRVSSPPSSYQAQVNGKTEPFLEEHVELLEKGIEKMCSQSMDQSSGDVPFKAVHGAQYEGSAHSTPLDIKININGREIATAVGEKWSEKVHAYTADHTQPALH